MYNLVDSGLIGFEEDINLDFAVLDLVHWQCYCCSMSRSEPGVFMQGFVIDM